jgi:hypothetical protein
MSGRDVELGTIEELEVVAFRSTIASLGGRLSRKAHFHLTIPSEVGNTNILVPKTDNLTCPPRHYYPSAPFDAEHSARAPA